MNSKIFIEIDCVRVCLLYSCLKPEKDERLYSFSQFAVNHVEALTGFVLYNLL